jgi:type VI protein secretion system component VasF
VVTDRRKKDRGTPDRRGERRVDMPWWSYPLAFVITGLTLVSFWSLVY